MLVYMPYPKSEWVPFYNPGECLSLLEDDKKINLKIKSVSLQDQFYLVEMLDEISNELIQIELDKDLIEKTKYIFLDKCEEPEKITI